MTAPTIMAPKEDGDLELPWQIKVDALGYPSIYGTNEDGGEGDLVAHCFADHEHLIRSAPELLDALRKLTQMARTSGGTPGPDASLMAACEKAEVAIASATRVSA